MSLIKTLIRALRLVDQQGLGVFRAVKKGYSISSFQILEGVAVHVKNISTIIDVGANQGQFAIASNNKFPNATIISFEPLPEMYEQFKANVNNNPRITIHNMALGDEAGVIDFYRNEHSHASSALVISDKQKETIPGTSNTTKIQVKVDRLDNVAASWTLHGPVLLKLDVQGYEKKVLLGAPALLKKIDYLLFETSFVPMYDGEPLFDEMHTFLKDAGFEIMGPVGFLEGSDNSILQMDLLYRRKK